MKRNFCKLALSVKKSLKTECTVTHISRDCWGFPAELTLHGLCYCSNPSCYMIVRIISIAWVVSRCSGDRRKRHKRDAHDPEDWSDRNQHSLLDRRCLSGQWASTTKVKLKRCLAHEENNWYEHYSQRLQVSMLPNLSRRLHSSLDVWESQPIMRPFLLTLYGVLPCALGTVVGYAVYTLSHLKFVCKFFKETVGKINPRGKKKATTILLKYQYWTLCFVIFHH